ncbi:hypothetical protein HN51_018033 [Arachis hypogaea]
MQERQAVYTNNRVAGRDNMKTVKGSDRGSPICWGFGGRRLSPTKDCLYSSRTENTKWCVVEIRLSPASILLVTDPSASEPQCPSDSGSLHSSSGGATTIHRRLHGMRATPLTPDTTPQWKM